VPDQARLFTGERGRLEVPAKTVAGLFPEARRCDVWSTWTVAGCNNLPLLIAIAKRTRSDGVDRNTLDPA
jgi:hypothetical protein